MKINGRSSAFIIGMALFAMFFGAGNLIYPLFIGKMSGGEMWISTSMGFLISAVLLPFLGVVAMVLYEGNYLHFFRTIGRVPGLVLAMTLLTVWIPLGSAPRCTTLAYASIASYTSYTPPPAVFSFLYSALVFYVVMRKIGLLDILGRYITPLLLTCIGIIACKGFSDLPSLTTKHLFSVPQLLNGLVEGYNTMDLIASFFFSASVIHFLNASGSGMKQTLSLVIRSSTIGIGILAAVYMCFISLAAHHTEILQGIPKDQLLAYLAQAILGETWSAVAILAIVLACFSTSIALILAYTDFLQTEVFKNTENPQIPTFLALAVTYVMSLFGLEGIAHVTAPILKVCYPILLGLIVYNIAKMLLKREKPQVAKAKETV
ncbi:MAG: branched-chain amino acid transport system II carrier protein [Waddliaceae bacterium]